MSRLHRLNFHRTIAAALGMLGSAGHAQGPVFSVLPPQRATLQAYQGAARPVLLFAPDAQHPDFKDQISELREARDGLLDRDIVVLCDTDPQAQGRLRTGLAVHGFEIVLVGKDGDVKLRARTPMTARALFSKIDAMPMRQEEMRGGIQSEIPS